MTRKLPIFRGACARNADSRSAGGGHGCGIPSYSQDRLVTQRMSHTLIECCQRIYSQSEYITQDVPHALGGQRRILSGVLRRSVASLKLKASGRDNAMNQTSIPKIHTMKWPSKTAPPLDALPHA